MPIFGGGGDLVSRIITRYEADAKQQIRELKKLEKEQDKLAKKTEKQKSDEEKQLDGLVAKYGKLAAGVGAAFAAYKVAEVSINHFASRSRLANAAVGKDIEALQRSASGLVSEMDLLRLAADASTGTFKLTQSELEVVTQGMVALSREGRDLENVTERVGQAIREGNVEPLKELGIIIKDVEGDSREAIDAMLAHFRKMGTGVEQEGESFRRLQVTVADTLDEIQSGIGEFALEIVDILEPFIDVGSAVIETLDAIGVSTKLMGEIMLSVTTLGVYPLIKALNELGTFDALGANIIADAQPRFANSDWTGGGGRPGSGLRGGGDAGATGGWGDEVSAWSDRAAQEIAVRDAQQAMDRQINEALAAADAFVAGNRGSGGRGDVSVIINVPGGQGFALDQLLANVGGVGDAVLQGVSGVGGTGVGARSRSRDRNPLERLGFTTDEIARLQEDLQATMADIRLGQQQSFLESAFGPIAEFDAYAQGFEMLSSTATAGFRAIVTGSESLGDAIKRALGDSILSLSLDMFSQSLRHGAYALGSLAFGNVPGATAHGQAAALFAAGAAATGLIANRLGAGGARAGAGRGSAGLTGRASLATSSGGGSNITIISNDDPTDSPRRRASNQAARIRMAQRFGVQGVGIGGHR